MPYTLANPDFITDRGPKVPVSDAAPNGIGERIKYTVTNEITEHIPTDGSPRTFYSVCRVKWDDKDAFLKAILPDVFEDADNPIQDAVLTMTPFGKSPEVAYYRNRLIRLAPQQHPYHRRAFAVDAQVLTGEGYVAKEDSVNWPTFYTNPIVPGDVFNDQGDRLPGTPHSGYARIGVTWRDLPYDVLVINGEGDDVTNETANAINFNESIRYCMFKTQIKGSNLTIPGAVAYYVDDDGTLVRKNSESPPMQVPETQPFFVAAETFGITMKMVPRVPLAARMMRGLVNASLTDIMLPSEVVKDLPDVGTMHYLGFEMSDPYYTVSETKVFDLTYQFGVRTSGKGPFRGWNASYCPIKRDFRRIVFGLLEGDVIRTPSGRELRLPVTSDDDPGQASRLVISDGCSYPFGQLGNLFCFEGRRVSP
jgi:hypothetical protein